jgi:long-chain acyl-CoA synthetase
MPEPKAGKERPWHRLWPPHLPHSLDYPDVPAWWVLERNIGRFDDKEAIVFLNYEDMSEIGRLTYGELYNSAVALSGGLRDLGIKKGDRVGTVLPNSPAIIQSYYGIWLAGGTIVPSSPMARAPELHKTLVNSGVTMLIAAEQNFPEARKACEGLDVRLVVASAGPSRGTDVPKDVPHFEGILKANREPLSDFTIDPTDDVAVILYTGGTTGDPKGAMLTHRNIVVNTIQFAEWYAFEPGKEICVCAIPMSHSGGMAGVMNVPLYSGATLLVMQRANPPVMGKVVEKYRATRLFGVPTLCAALLNDKEASCCDYSSLKACRTGAAPLPVNIKEAFDEMAKKEVLVEAYGITETSPLCVANTIQCPKAGSIGIPLPDTDAKIVDIETGEEVPHNTEGELLIRGPQVMKGYLNNPEATAEAIQDGWFRTGDVVRMDGEGYLYVVDRLKDFINASGFKVWPREVEEILYKYPGVKLAAVVGIPDPYRGENVKAFIVPADEAKGSIQEDDIIAFCRKRLSAYKVPHIIEFRDELALSAAGKILRRVLRDEERRKYEESKRDPGKQKPMGRER